MACKVNGFPVALTGGRVRNSRNKTAYVCELSIVELVRRHPHSILCTLTFHDCITDKPEARKRWRRLRERISRKWPGLEAVGVWQRQDRGAWHLHLVCSQRLPVGELRAMAVECGFGQMMRLDYIGGRNGYRRSNRAGSVRGVVRYLCRYLTRDLTEGRGDGCLVVYVRAKRGTVKFTWTKGLAKLWRLGMDYLTSLEHRVFDGPLHEVPFIVVARIGFESLSEPEQAWLLETDSGVSRWWYSTDIHEGPF